MIGSQSDPGIMVRVMEDLFHHSKRQGKQQGVQFKVTVSFLEVYNENIRDLLSDVEEYLDLREDPIKGPVVASITEIETTSGQEIMQLLHQVILLLSSVLSFCSTFIFPFFDSLLTTTTILPGKCKAISSSNSSERSFLSFSCSSSSCCRVPRSSARNSRKHQSRQIVISRFSWFRTSCKHKELWTTFSWRS